MQAWARGDDSEGWIAVVDEEKTFDLVEVQGSEVFLGTSEMAAGKYTQIRLDVIKVMLP
jgi:hypothetical protein